MGWLVASRPWFRDERSWGEDEHARALLANLIDFERREEKVSFWEKFALQGMEPESLAVAGKGVAGLEFIDRAGGTDRAPIHRYRYPSQELDVRSHDDLYTVVDRRGEKVGQVVSCDPHQHTLDVKKLVRAASVHPEHGFLWNIVKAPTITAARLEFAHDVIGRGFMAEGPSSHRRFRAARDILQRIAGRGLSDPPSAQRLPDESTLDSAIRMTRGLDGGVLPVQGPPDCTHRAPI
ncbi:MAG: hypothetical protein WD273_06275 [Trueperaceae bacterium]